MNPISSLAAEPKTAPRNNGTCCPPRSLVSLRTGIWRCGFLARSQAKKRTATGPLSLCRLLAKVSGFVAAGAERNQPLFHVTSQPAARLEVMNLEILRSAAVLASPSVARQHFARELAIRVGFKP